MDTKNTIESQIKKKIRPRNKEIYYPDRNRISFTNGFIIFGGNVICFACKKKNCLSQNKNKYFEAEIRKRKVLHTVALYIIPSTIRKKISLSLRCVFEPSDSVFVCAVSILLFSFVIIFI